MSRLCKFSTQIYMAKSQCIPVIIAVFKAQLSLAFRPRYMNRDYSVKSLFYFLLHNVKHMFR